VSDQDCYLLDGLGPVPVFQPSTVTEVTELVRRKAFENLAIYPVGGRTMLDYGFGKALWLTCGVLTKSSTTRPAT
jgi:hypothetical protein